LRPAQSLGFYLPFRHCFITRRVPLCPPLRLSQAASINRAPAANSQARWTQRSAAHTLLK
jgi:hypothetical protein